MTIKVIGAGLPRTGTYSLKVALEKLLNAPCYHMSEVHVHPEHTKFWLDTSTGKTSDWHGFYSNYAATVDSPSAYFWRELMEAYPDAIVILTVRDAQSWWESASKTIFQAVTMSHLSEEHKTMLKALPSPFRGKERNDREAMIQSYEQHNIAVKAAVPAQRLLIWDAKEGWEPICRILNLPIPDEPFPHTNTTKEFRKEWSSGMFVGKRLLKFLFGR